MQTGYELVYTSVDWLLTIVDKCRLVKSSTVSSNSVHVMSEPATECQDERDKVAKAKTKTGQFLRTCPFLSDMLKTLKSHLFPCSSVKTYWDHIDPNRTAC